MPVRECVRLILFVNSSMIFLRVSQAFCSLIQPRKSKHTLQQNGGPGPPNPHPEQGPGLCSLIHRGFIRSESLAVRLSCRMEKKLYFVRNTGASVGVTALPNIACQLCFRSPTCLACSSAEAVVALLQASVAELAIEVFDRVTGYFETSKGLVFLTGNNISLLISG